MTCKQPKECTDTCTIYDLCKVTVKKGDGTVGQCLPHDGTETDIICEGFKFTSKLDVEVKTNSACYEGYGYQISNMQYDWEITNPCDHLWFDKRFVAQICDKYSMEITGYAQTNCGEFEPIEKLTACIIEETGRDYGKGMNRSIRGKALHRVLLKDKEDSEGNITNASKSYVNKGGADMNGNVDYNSNGNVEWWQEGGAFDQVMTVENLEKVLATYRNMFAGGAGGLAGIGSPTWWINQGLKTTGLFP